MGINLDLPFIMIPTTPLYRHQKNIWNVGFKERTVNGITGKARFIALEWHRRSGKDIGSLPPCGGGGLPLLQLWGCDVDSLKIGR